MIELIKYQRTELGDIQGLFLNVRKCTGAVVISAANANQLAYEEGGFENGVFTYCILQLMESEESS